MQKVSSWLVGYFCMPFGGCCALRDSAAACFFASEGRRQTHKRPNRVSAGAFEPIKSAIFSSLQPFMSFLHSLPWRSAHVPPIRWTRWGGQTALWLGICTVGLAQPAPTLTGLDAIKKALQTGQLEQAQKLVAQARDSAPKEVQWQFMEGVIQAQQGQTDKAIETFRKITEKNPDQSEAFNNLGVLYAAKGRLEESRAYLEKALLTHPSYAAAHRNLSDVLSQLAKDSYGKALQVDPKARSSTPQLTLLGAIAPDPRQNPGPSPIPSAGTAVAQAPAKSEGNAERILPPTTRAATQPAGKAPQASAPSVLPPAAAAKAPVAATAASSAPSPSPQVKPALGTAAVIASAASQPATAAATPPAAKPPAAAPSANPVPAKTPAAPAAVTPAATVASTPKATTPAPDSGHAAQQQAVQAAVAAWAKAWSQKDMNGYFAAYTRNFTPGNMSRSQWEADRQLKILSKRSITVDVQQLQISIQGDKASARFRQIYTSDNFKGNSRKTLELSQQGDRWLITREFVN
jgi:tetratricopeptide (TPR) repeat protein/ketosteroid isomerase-like protein